MIDTANKLIAEGQYAPLAVSGYIAHEASAAFLNLVGGAILTNLRTTLMSLWAVYSFFCILEYHAIPQRTLLTLIFITNPLYWVNSTVTMDYVWAMPPLLVGYRLLLKRRYGWSGVALGLALGARLSSGVFALILLSF